MRIAEIIHELEKWAHPSLAEDYDNVGLLTGNKQWEVTGVLTTLDCTEDIIEEAIAKKCNLVIAHHPIVFKGLKRFTGGNYVERVIIAALKNDIAIYAFHTNLDSIKTGVNRMIAEKLGLLTGSLKILAPKENTLKQITCYVPLENANEVAEAMHQAGAGHIGNYSHCSFRTQGIGYFKPEKGANPYEGIIGIPHANAETAIEMILPAYAEGKVISAMQAAHPYEEVAYFVNSLDNAWQEAGSGMVGEFETPVETQVFLEKLKEAFNLKVVKHTEIVKSAIQRVALCGGSGFFLLKNAMASKADAYITSDIKYHEFFDADNQLLLADIGHYESEQYTSELIAKHLSQKFGNIAVLLSEVNTNPVKYF